MRWNIVRIPDGEPGTVVTLENMARLAREGATPATANFALDAIEPRVRLEHLNASYSDDDFFADVREWLASVIDFTPDPPGVQDTLYGVPVMLDMIARTGKLSVDCDDVAVLAAAILLAVGYSVRFVAVSLTDGPQYTHVWAEARGRVRPSLIVEFDVTRPMQRIPVNAVTHTILYPVA